MSNRGRFFGLFRTPITSRSNRPRGALRDVEVGVRHRVERAGEDRHSRHASPASRKVSIVSPKRRWRTGRRPPTSGGSVRQKCLITTDAPGSQVRHQGAKRRHDSTHLVRRIEHARSHGPVRRREEPLDVQLVDRGVWPARSRALEVRAQRLVSAARSRSTKSASSAPRDSASIPIAPLPAYRSRTRASGTRSPRMREQRLLDPIGDRPRRRAARRRQRHAPGRAGDDAHQAASPSASTGAKSRLQARQLRPPASSGSAPTSASARSRARSARRRCRGSNRVATFSGGRPDCRVPSRLPAPRRREILLGDVEAVERSAHDLERARAPADRCVREEDAEGPMRSAPDPPAQLVELRQAEALGVLDEHHARVRHVDPDLDDRRRDEHVHLPRREGGHRRVAHVGALLAVDERRPAAPGARPAAGPPRPRRSRPRAPRTRRTSGTTTNDWRPSAASAARNASIFGSAPTVADLGADRLPARRQLADRADRQVAVHGQGQRPRDGRGGQRQRVRLAAGALGLECGALADPEAVLLVDDRQAEARELDRLADDGVRADDDLGHRRRRSRRGSRACALAASDPDRNSARTPRPSSSGASPAWCCRARISVGAISAACHPARTARASATAATAVLPLPTSPWSRRRIGRSDGEVLDDRGDGRRLVAGQGERQRPDDLGPRSASVTRWPAPCSVVARLPSLRQAELEREELVEREPVERAGHVGRVLGEVGGAAEPRRGAGGRRAPHRSGGPRATGSAASRMRASSSRSRFWVTPAARW